ncbi:MAG TPA: TetR/AcrR family transcriptional regulator [Spirochaetota bacterium]|nr:TetR/AcrR family transcriptional regulator [Spirochaetota bacterium]HPC42712.1 TetR/AcrR family transcriptional regulator [Spirochaetota bacterium]HPL16377.1 TetR/AcrR family transcriptional regulator [Spirochaetota bacterium]HQF08336.1 TetR/AcrR family transcriptional regulator [Spirochaetota bacterium]HQH98973.1 TetR/AcrR family transcriptional regulator [Spirochaetota bacterium]
MPPKGERRKQQIVDTAKQMFIEKGFQSTHIGQVCEKLDIARGTVYQYFRNKKEILYAILEDVLEKIEDIFDQDDFNEFFSSNPNSEQILEFINKRLMSCISVLLGEPIVIKLIYKEIIGVDEDVNEEVGKAVAAISKHVAREVEDLMARGVYKQSLDPKITAMMIVGGVMLVVYEYDRTKQNVLDSNLISIIAKNYLYGVLK